MAATFSTEVDHMAKIELLDPTGVIPETKGAEAPRLDTMDGKRIGFRVDWRNYDVFCDEADRHLREAYELQDVTHYYPKSRTTATEKEGTKALKEFAGTVDAMAVGLAA